MYLKSRIIVGKIKTPLLLPSFSSKGFPYINKILETAKSYIDTPFLISAYDLYYNYINFPNNNPNLLFIDSGGYESSDFQDMSEISNYNIKNNEWDFEKYTEIINKITKQANPMVIINYDNYKKHFPLIKQIEQAITGFQQYPGVIKEFLIKSETSENYININSIVSNITYFTNFDIIGITEKELGCTVKERIINLYKLRKCLQETNIDKPIHIFGCLDTITMPLYFLAGADIFDGLCWLRYAFYNDITIYKSLAFLFEQKIDLNEVQQDIYNQVNNYKYLKNLQNNLLEYIKTKDINFLGKYGDTLMAIYNNAIMEV